MIYVLTIIVIILIMPIKIVAIKDDRHSDVDIHFTKILDIKLDFDQLLRRLFSEKGDPERITFRSFLSSIGLYRQAKNIITTTTKMISIKKMTFIIKTKSSSLDSDTWGFVFSWIVFGYFQDYVHRYFKAVENEYYNHQIAPANKINFECHFNIRLVYLLFALIRNIKDIPKVIRFIKKGNKAYGTSNF
ncbi:MAG: hypothetical protein PHV87_03290 [Bacilli bacterium]|nr:hypothetical protein [Bacilli bacterium]